MDLCNRLLAFVHLSHVWRNKQKRLYAAVWTETIQKILYRATFAATIAPHLNYKIGRCWRKQPPPHFQPSAFTVFYNYTSSSWKMVNAYVRHCSTNILRISHPLSICYKWEGGQAFGVANLVCLRIQRVRWRNQYSLYPRKTVESHGLWTSPL